MNCDKCKNKYKKISGSCLPMNELIVKARGNKKYEEKLNRVFSWFVEKHIENGIKVFLSEVCVDCEKDNDFIIKPYEL